ncbi:hypothetical protein HDV06_006567 [Boothiomyces sp. JEL0866]|nr:hypothetical protein HDV06_006567 [Boothiomyces sp. JEL0866]
MIEHENVYAILVSTVLNMTFTEKQKTNKQFIIKFIDFAKSYEKFKKEQVIEKYILPQENTYDYVKKELGVLSIKNKNGAPINPPKEIEDIHKYIESDPSNDEIQKIIYGDKGKHPLLYDISKSNKIKTNFILDKNILDRPIYKQTINGIEKKKNGDRLTKIYTKELFENQKGHFQIYKNPNIDVIFLEEEFRNINKKLDGFKYFRILEEQFKCNIFILELHHNGILKHSTTKSPNYIWYINPNYKNVVVLKNYSIVDYNNYNPPYELLINIENYEDLIESKYKILNNNILPEKYRVSTVEEKNIINFDDLIKIFDLKRTVQYDDHIIFTDQTYTDKHYLELFDEKNKKIKVSEEYLEKLYSLLFNDSNELLKILEKEQYIINKTTSSLQFFEYDYYEACKKSMTKETYVKGKNFIQSNYKPKDDKDDNKIYIENFYNFPIKCDEIDSNEIFEKEILQADKVTLKFLIKKDKIDLLLMTSGINGENFNNMIIEEEKICRDFLKQNKILKPKVSKFDYDNEYSKIIYLPFNENYHYVLEEHDELTFIKLLKFNIFFYQIQYGLLFDKSKLKNENDKLEIKIVGVPILSTKSLYKYKNKEDQEIWRIERNLVNFYSSRKNDINELNNNQLKLLGMTNKKMISNEDFLDSDHEDSGLDINNLNIDENEDIKFD